jgi:hypothetical protein
VAPPAIVSSSPAKWTKMKAGAIASTQAALCFNTRVRNGAANAARNGKTSAKKVSDCDPLAIQKSCFRASRRAGDAIVS